jgi:hypothetical protein
VEDLEFVVNIGRATEALKYRAAAGFVQVRHPLPLFEFLISSEWFLGIQHKFGRYHARIIRLLLDKKCLDEKTV